jgi:hypothetical protein
MGLKQQHTHTADLQSYYRAIAKGVQSRFKAGSNLTQNLALVETAFS